MARLMDFVYFLYFLSHIPIAIFFDSQALFPNSWYPRWASDAIAWHCRVNKDVLMAAPPAWFQSFIVCEISFQLPFFFVATYAFYKGGCKWIRIPSMVYGAHVTTTLVPILAHIWFHDFTGSALPAPVSTEDKLKLSAIYGPYAIIPPVLLLHMLFNKNYGSSSKQKSQ